jgi:hypothetical protein
VSTGRWRATSRSVLLQQIGRSPDLRQAVAREGGAAPVVEAARSDAALVGVDGVDAPAVAVAHGVGCRFVRVASRTGMVGSLRRLMIRSPTATRCPRAAPMVGAFGSMVSCWIRRLSASAISVVSHNSRASVPAAVYRPPREVLENEPEA